MPSYYCTISETESFPKKSPWQAAALAVGACFFSVLALNAVLPSTLFATGTSNVQAVQPVVTYAPAKVTHAVVMGRQAVPTKQETALSVEPESQQRTTVGLATVASGLLVLFAAAATLLHQFFTPANKETNSDPLGLAKYQGAEEHWSMTAASAFVGTKAPTFKATAVFDEEFVDVDLSDYKGKKYVVLFFYPLDFTFVCPTEITAFSDRAAEFEALNTQILGVSIDSQFSHLAWIQTPRNQGGLGEIKYPLVADLKKDIAEAYGVLTEDGVALRGLFIIDKEGTIQHATINNLAFGRNVDETLRVLEALQHVQANPDEVCPAGWKKGDRTMKPDPVGSKEYFKAI